MISAACLSCVESFGLTLLCLRPMQDKFFCKVQQILLNKQEDFCGNKKELVRTMQVYNGNVRAAFFWQMWQKSFLVLDAERRWRRADVISCLSVWKQTPGGDVRRRGSAVQTFGSRQSLCPAQKLVRAVEEAAATENHRNSTGMWFFFCCFFRFNIKYVVFWSKCCQIQAERFLLAWLFIFVLYLM